MARCYAILVRKGLKKIEEVPEELKKEVQEILDSYDN